MAVPPPSCRPPASLSHPGSRRPRHRKPAPNRPPNPSAAAGRGVVPRAPEFPESLHPVRYLALSGVQVEFEIGVRPLRDGCGPLALGDRSKLSRCSAATAPPPEPSRTTGIRLRVQGPTERVSASPPAPATERAQKT